MLKLDVDDHHAALALFAWRSDGGAIEVRAVALDGKLATTLAFTASFLFFLEDFFDDPGIQHGGPPFGLLSWLTIRTPASVSVAPVSIWCNRCALRCCFPRNYSNASKFGASTSRLPKSCRVRSAKNKDNERVL